MSTINKEIIIILILLLLLLLLLLIIILIVVKKSKRGEKKEPWWKRRIECGITSLRKDINRLERERRGETGGKGKRKIKELNVKYRVKKKGINLIIDEA